MSAVARPLDATEMTSLVAFRRLRSLAGVDQVRLFAAAVVVFLLIDFLRLSLVSPVPFGDRALPVAMDVVAYAALVVALWRPLIALPLVAVPLLTALVWTSTSLDAVLIVAVGALALAQLDRLPALAASLGFSGYVLARVLLYPGEAHGMLALTLGVALALGLGLGWLGRGMRARRRRAEQRSVALAAEDARIRADERRLLAADVHDVVVHELSTASLQLMGAESLTDPDAFRRVARTVDGANRAALRELRLLMNVLRDSPAMFAPGSEVRELSERVPPTQAGAEAELRLIAAGLEPAVSVPAAADALALTAQRTVSRVIREASGNQIRHAPRQARCTIRVHVGEHDATVEARNPLPDAPPGHLGWGLKGVRERVLLTGGTFAAGPSGDAWVVTASVPLD